QTPADEHAGPDLEQATPLSRPPLAIFEILDGLLDDGAVYPPHLVRIADQQAVVAEYVDEAWDPARVLRDPGDRRIGEEPKVGRPGDPEPSADIVASLL